MKRSIPFAPFYTAFAPVRSGISAQFYIDGKDTFEVMTTSIENAKKHIFYEFLDLLSCDLCNFYFDFNSFLFIL